MRVLTTDGVLDLEVADEDERSAVASHWNYVDLYLATGNTEGLDDLRGLKVAGKELETDGGFIAEREAEGQLGIGDIYNAG